MTPRQNLRLYLAVGFGAALGALARYLVSFGVTGGLALPSFGGTALANVVGSFLIAWFAVVSGPNGRWLVGPAARQFVMTGFCGGLTTFSAMSLDGLLLAFANRPLAAAFYLATVVAASLGAAWAGNALAQRQNTV